jgi:hypothetical protein
LRNGARSGALEKIFLHNNFSATIELFVPQNRIDLDVNDNNANA